MNTNPNIYLLRFGELALKGRNRNAFVNDLVKIIKPRIKPLEGRIEKHHKKLLLFCDAPPEKVRAALSTVFGLSGISPIWRTTHELDSIKELAWQLVEKHANTGKTFAVRAKRALKTYPMNSMQLAQEVAGHVLERGLNLPVDLDNSQLTLGINIGFQECWLFLETWPTMGGLPVRGRDKYGLLLSGGIDSPVAGNLMQKRGAWINAIYFHTPPYTVEAAREKVIDLATVLANYQNRLWLQVVNFTEVMQTIKAECEDSHTIIISRRFMMRAANRIMAKIGGKGLITGESLGQVASQTIENIGVVNAVSELPVLRPLISMDKTEIMRLARRIDTYDISIRPFVDCCSLFSPKEPVTSAKLYYVLKQEARLDVEGLLERALASVEEIAICPTFQD